VRVLSVLGFILDKNFTVMSVNEKKMMPSLLVILFNEHGII
jgi:hypothetical protein